MPRLGQKSASILYCVCILLGLWYSPARSLGQGALTPPAAPGPTMKTLDQIEPRHPLKQSDFPVTISVPGSYYLTENVVVAAPAGFGIDIQANDVAIDLGGFTLQGPGKAVGGVSVGIQRTSGVGSAVSISNGTVREWKNNGIWISQVYPCRFSQLSVHDNGADGIYALCPAVISDCVVTSNGARGIQASSPSVIARCVANGNDFGIYVSDGCAVENCAARGNTFEGFTGGNYYSFLNCSAEANGRDGFGVLYSGTLLGCTAGGNANGFEVGGYSTLVACSASNNTGVGFKVDIGSAVSQCTAAANGSYGFFLLGSLSITQCTAQLNTDNGFEVFGRCRVLNNLSDGNKADGFRFTQAGNTIDGNTSTSNMSDGFRMDVSGNFVVRNVASGNGFNFGSAGTQTIGPIVTATGTIASTSPWANFEF